MRYDIKPHFTYLFGYIFSRVIIKKQFLSPQNLRMNISYLRINVNLFI